MNKLISRYKYAFEQLQKWKNVNFPRGSTVYVECDRYSGLGIVAMSESCPLDKLAVKLENGNTWHYPLECCQRHQPAALNLLPRANRSLSKNEARKVHFQQRFYERVGYKISEENLKKLIEKTHKEGKSIYSRGAEAVFSVNWEGVELLVLLDKFTLQPITILPPNQNYKV